MEYERAEACVVEVVVLFPYGCASDGDYDASAGFADFYGGSVNGGDYCFLIVWFERYWLAFELKVRGMLLPSGELVKGLLI